MREWLERFRLRLSRLGPTQWAVSVWNMSTEDWGKLEKKARDGARGISDFINNIVHASIGLFAFQILREFADKSHGWKQAILAVCAASTIALVSLLMASIWLSIFFLFQSGSAYERNWFKRIFLLAFCFFAMFGCSYGLFLVTSEMAKRAIF